MLLSMISNVTLVVCSRESYHLASGSAGPSSRWLKAMGKGVSRCLKHKRICVKGVSRPLCKTPRGNHVFESPFCPLIYVRVEDC